MSKVRRSKVRRSKVRRSKVRRNRSNRRIRGGGWPPGLYNLHSNKFKDHNGNPAYGYRYRPTADYNWSAWTPGTPHIIRSGGSEPEDGTFWFLNNGNIREFKT